MTSIVKITPGWDEVINPDHESEEQAAERLHWMTEEDEGRQGSARKPFDKDAVKHRGKRILRTEERGYAIYFDDESIRQIRDGIEFDLIDFLTRKKR